MFFTSKSELSIDAKHRLAIPARIRAMLDPQTHGEAFYVIQGVNDALWLWPEKTFERIAGEIEPSFTPAPELMDFDELMFPEARRVEIDAAGRIRLTEEMLAEAGLGTRVLVLGVRFHLEIWDPERWAARRRDKRERRDEITERARDVLPPPTRTRPPAG